MLNLRFGVPPDGMPCVRDWITTYESILQGGLDLSREPISVNVPGSIVKLLKLFEISVHKPKGSVYALNKHFYVKSIYFFVCLSLRHEHLVEV